MHRLAARFMRIATACAAAAGCIVLWALPPVSRNIDPESFPRSAPDMTGTTVSGAFHVHSRWSDGGGTVNEIAAAAAAAGLDFVILTDHGDATVHRPPSWRHGVLVVHGVEISTDAGHYVALGLPAAPYPLGGDARGVVEDVRRLGGFGVIAHPTSLRAALAWSQWSVTVDGIEWLNGDSQWRDDSLLGLLRAASGYWFRPPESLASLLARPEHALARWDALAAERPVVGLGAADAHARLAFGQDEHGYGGGVEVRFPGYEEIFRTFAIRVVLDRAFTGRAVVDAENVIGRIRAGRVYTVVDALASPVRFTYAAGTAAGGTVRMGERAPPGRDLTLSVAVAAPADAAIRLFRNGRTVAQEAGRTLVYPVPRTDGRAAYRVEVVLPEAPGRPAVPWIVSNPIYVGAAVPTAVPPTPRGTSLPAPGEPWQIERHTGAAATLTEDGDGFRLAFTLGNSADTYVAAARTFRPGAFAGVGALRFDAEASQPMRVSLQLRRRRGRGGGPAARWRRSFHVGPEPRVVRSPIEEFAPAWRDVPPDLDPAAVNALLIVVDTVNTAPGTSGVLTVEDVRVEPGRIR